MSRFSRRSRGDRAGETAHFRLVDAIDPGGSTPLPSLPMNARPLLRRVAAVVVIAAVAVLARAQAPQEAYTNLKVLPKDISPAELRATMGGFTRALGVRCVYCHVGEEGKPLRHEDFAKDDKPTKVKARAMMLMVRDVNDKYLATLDHRAEPPIRVQCVTCHHGSPLPRTLQDVLKTSYDQGGLDSAITRYQALRDRYYGRFTYDFGEVPLADLAGAVREAGHPADAVRLHAFNVEMNPKSAFAKRQHAGAAIFVAFRDGGADSGRADYRRMLALYGPGVVNEGLLDDLGASLLHAGQTAPAVAAFELSVAEHPSSGDAYDGLGEAYATAGNRRKAMAAYTKAVALDSTNVNAKAKLEELKRPPKKDRKR
jgi:photosynthetic reaction center cytochrome c subunit